MTKQQENITRLCSSSSCFDGCATCTRCPAPLRRYSIADIAAHSQKIGHHYFDRKTLAFFGQRRSDFRAYTSPSGRVFIHGASSRPFMHTHGLVSTAEYFPLTGDIRKPQGMPEGKVSRADFRAWVKTVR